MITRASSLIYTERPCPLRPAASYALNNSCLWHRAFCTPRTYPKGQVCTKIAFDHSLFFFSLPFYLFLCSSVNPLHYAYRYSIVCLDKRMCISNCHIYLTFGTLIKWNNKEVLHAHSNGWNRQRFCEKIR